MERQQHPGPARHESRYQRHRARDSEYGFALAHGQDNQPVVTEVSAKTVVVKADSRKARVAGNTRETVKTVQFVSGSSFTQLKLGVNETGGRLWQS